MTKISRVLEYYYWTMLLFVFKPAMLNFALNLNSEAEDVSEVDKIDYPLIEVPDGEQRLQYEYGLWFSRRGQGKQAQSYDQQLKLVGRFASVEQFWSYYSHISRPSQISGHADFHLFKSGIKPMWEDSANKNGGKWIVRLRKGLADRLWENLILAILGEQFVVGSEICGAVISLRYQKFPETMLAAPNIPEN
nr:EOG090X0BMA [Artemia franciscana]